MERRNQHAREHHSSSAKIFRFRAGLTVLEPGRLCAIRRDSFFASASVICRRSFVACKIPFRSAMTRTQDGGVARPHAR